MSPEKPQSFDQMKQQHEKQQPMSVLVRRSPDALHPDGWISTGWATGKKNERGLYQVIVHTPEGVGHKFVSADRLSDAGQEGLANELGADIEPEALIDTVPRSELLADVAVAEMHEAKQAEQKEEVLEIGEEALTAAEIVEPSPEQRERPKELQTTEAAKKRIEAITAAGPEASTLAAVLLAAGESPEAVLGRLGNRETRDSVRAALRTRLGMLIQEMPERIQMNTEKNAEPRLGYQAKIRSQDYAIEIALAYLDGSFKATESLDGDGEGGIGQHRTAAQKLLESFTPDAQSDAKEKLQFNADRLQSFMLELGGRVGTAALEMSLITSANGVLDVVQQDLRSDFIDTDNLADYAAAISAKVEQTILSLNSEIGRMHTLEGELNRDGTADMSKIEHVEQKVYEVITLLDTASHSYVGSMLNVNQFRYGDVGHTVSQLRLIARNGSQFEDELMGPFQRAKAILDELAGQLS